MNRHPDITRERVIATCTECKGAGETTHNDSHDGDPQCEYDVRCGECLGRGEVTRWEDPLILLAATRRSWRAHSIFYVRARRRAMAPTRVGHFERVRAAEQLAADAKAIRDSLRAAA